MEKIIIKLFASEALEVHELLEAWLSEHESDRFCEAKEGFTEENRIRSDRLHRLSIADSEIQTAIEEARQTERAKAVE